MNIYITPEEAQTSEPGAFVPFDRSFGILESLVREGNTAVGKELFQSSGDHPARTGRWV